MSDYERGEWDCRYGFEAKPGQSKEYYEGYGFKYEKEQQEDARTS